MSDYKDFMGSLGANFKSYSEDMRGEIKKSALEYVKSLFERPEQLENLEMILSKELKWKEVCETKMQSLLKIHIDNLRLSANELRLAGIEAQAVQSGMQEIKRICAEFRELEPKLNKLGDLSQTASASWNAANLLMQLMNMSDTIDNTKNLIKEGNLLQAHKNIRELENIRDKIFSKQLESAILSPEPRKALDQWPLARNFDGINTLNSALRAKLVMILQKTVAYCVEEPTSLVTAMRIIEREEAVDEYWKKMKKEGATQKCCYIPFDRPKRWSTIVQKSIEEAVKEKFNMWRSTVDFANNKHATAEFLELLRKHTLNDLLTIQDHAVYCFPPTYDILNQFCYVYHNATVEILDNLMCSWGSNPNEKDIVAVLLFENQYTGDQLYGHSSFHKSVRDIINSDRPLLQDSMKLRLQELYVSNICNLLNNKVERMVGLEEKDWRSGVEPVHKAGLYYTQLPNYYNELIGVHLVGANLLTVDVYWGVFMSCLTAFETLVNKYIDAFDTYVKSNYPTSSTSMSISTTALSTISNMLNPDKTNPPADTSKASTQQQWRFFVQYCIAVANNCTEIQNFMETSCKQVSQDMSKRGDEKSRHDEIQGENISSRVISVGTSLEELSKKCVKAICNDFIYDLLPGFGDFLTKLWREKAEVWSEGLRDVVENFSKIITFLHPKFQPEVFKTLDFLIAHQYLTAFMNHRARYIYDELESYGKIIHGDGSFLAQFFSSRLGQANEDAWCYAICQCADVFRASEPTVAGIDLFLLFRTYTDFTFEHGVSLLSTRGDMTRDVIIKTVSDLTSNLLPNTNSKFGLFKEIKIEKSDRRNINSIFTVSH